MHHILLCGTGTMGQTHARAYRAMADAAVVGVVDNHAEQAQKIASWFDCPVYATFEEAVAGSVHFDIVDICLPTTLHYEFVTKAADQGKHIICEKPLARHSAQAREMIDYCKRKGVELYVGHVVRFFPEYALAKKQMDAGVIGKPAVVSMSRCGPFPQGGRNWYADKEQSGGTPLDLMIHDFDFLRYCFGEVSHVYAKGLYNSNLRNMDYTLATLRFKNGVIAHVEGSWSHPKFGTKFEFAGDKGIIDYDSFKETALTVHRRTSESGMPGVAVPRSPLKHSPYYLELRHFLDCIETGQTPIVTAEDAMEAVRIAEKVIASIQSGKRIEL